MSTENRHTEVPAWKLERFLLGELPAAEMDRIRNQVATDAQLERQLDALRADSELMYGRYPVEWMARRIERRADQWGQQPQKLFTLSPIRWPRMWPVPAAVGLAAVLALISVGDDVGDSGDFNQNPLPGIRLKGTGPRLSLHRKIDNGSEQLVDGAVGHAGDQIQVRYHAAGRPFGAILSVDGNGAVMVHLPASGDRAQTLQSAGPVSLEFAIELDDAPRWERFYFVTSESEFELAAVTKAAAATATTKRDSLALGDGQAQFLVTLNKEPVSEGFGGGE